MTSAGCPVRSTACLPRPIRTGSSSSATTSRPMASRRSSLGTPTRASGITAGTSNRLRGQRQSDDRAVRVRVAPVPVRRRPASADLPGTDGEPGGGGAGSGTQAVHGADGMRSIRRGRQTRRAGLFRFLAPEVAPWRDPGAGRVPPVGRGARRPAVEYRVARDLRAGLSGDGRILPRGDRIDGRYSRWPPGPQPTGRSVTSRNPYCTTRSAATRSPRAYRRRTSIGRACCHRSRQRWCQLSPFMSTGAR